MSGRGIRDLELFDDECDEEWTEEEAQKYEQKRQRRQEEQARITRLGERHDQLRSYTSGLYDEVDKISKKWPDKPVSDLTLEQANRSIREVKALLEVDDDDLIAETQEFVPAGDNPESRDVLLVLRQLKGALNRLESKYSGRHLEKWVLTGSYEG